MPALCGKCVRIHPKEDHPHTNYHQCTKYKVRLFHLRFHPDFLRPTMCESPVLVYKNSEGGCTHNTTANKC